MNGFKRYNTVSREELKALVGGKIDIMDTDMDGSQKTAIKKGQATEA